MLGENALYITRRLASSCAGFNCIYKRQSTFVGVGFYHEQANVFCTFAFKPMYLPTIWNRPFLTKYDLITALVIIANFSDILSNMGIQCAHATSNDFDLGRKSCGSPQHLRLLRNAHGITSKADDLGVRKQTLQTRTQWDLIRHAWFLIRIGLVSQQQINE